MISRDLRGLEIAIGNDILLFIHDGNITLVIAASVRIDGVVTTTGEHFGETTPDAVPDRGNSVGLGQGGGGTTDTGTRLVEWGVTDN